MISGRARETAPMASLTLTALKACATEAKGFSWALMSALLLGVWLLACTAGQPLQASELQTEVAVFSVAAATSCEASWLCVLRHQVLSVARR